MSNDKDNKRTRFETGLSQNPVFPFEGAEYDELPRKDVIKEMAAVRGISVEEMMEAAKDGMLMYPDAGQIAGPEQLGMDVGEYWRKLAGVDDVPLSPTERFANLLESMSDEEVRQLAIDITNGTKSSWDYPITVLTNELASRGLNIKCVHDVQIKKGDCCDGSMFQFGEIAEVCVKPPEFTEILELHGAVICVEKAPADKKLPSMLTILGDGVNDVYFNRNLMPHWMREILYMSAKNDPETAHALKQLWKQMEAAVTKRPRKKKDGTSRSSLSELYKPSAKEAAEMRTRRKTAEKAIKRLIKSKDDLVSNHSAVESIVAETVAEKAKK